jgi:hypothetical protein
MCVVSMIGDHYQQKWQGIQGSQQNSIPWPPQQQPNDHGIGQAGIGGMSGLHMQPPISRAEFDELKKEVLEMKQLLLAAKAFDEKTGQPDCEQESKVALLRRVAEAVGVSLDEIFEKRPAI